MREIFLIEANSAGNSKSYSQGFQQKSGEF